MKRCLRAAALMLCGLTLSACLGGCKPRLSLKIGEGPADAPAFAGTSYASTLNVRVGALFSPLLQTVAALERAGVRARLDYALVYDEGGAVLNATLVGEGDGGGTASVAAMNAGRVSLPPLRVDRAGEISGDERFDARMLGDVGYFMDLLLLSSLGVDAAAADYDAAASERGVAALGVALYEGFGGKVDVSSAIDGAWEESAKAYAAGLFGDSGGAAALSAAALSPPEFYAGVETFVNTFYALRYTDLGRVATVGDGVRYLSLYLAPAGLLGGEGLEQRLRAWTDRLDEPLERGKWASLCRHAFEALNVQPPEDAYIEYPVKDSRHADVKYVLGYGLVDAYPGYDTYSPELDIRLYELSGLCRRFTTTVETLRFDETSSVYDMAYTHRQAVRFYARLVADCLDFPGASQAVVRVINDRAYDFYARQAETGEYSDVNCMPTLAYMCLLWQNGAFDVPVAQIRADTDPKGTGGWTLSMAKQALEKYGGRFEEWLLGYRTPARDIERMVGELDRGRVLFAMMHEGDLDYDGHCLLVYGYERSGESLWFFAHDPGLGMATDVFGKPLGKARKLEAHYAQWIIERWSYAVLSILP